MEKGFGMKKVIMIGLVGFLASCGAEGDPLKPTAKLGFGIGPGGIVPRLSIGAKNSAVGIGIGAGGASVTAGQGPVSVSAGL